MFGQNMVQSSWANPQQTQQQTQGSAFGQPSAFGSGAFNSSMNAFGQQQQPAANPTASNNTSAFGAKPATGFGAFGGGTSAFGGGGAFGGAPTTGTLGTNVFGSTAPGTGSAFGGGASLFAQPKSGTSFSSTAPASTDANPPPVTTGTSTPAYSVFNEKDPSNSSIMLQYQTITATPAYRGTTLEELRFQDYQQNRKTAGAFGQTSFGTPAPQTTTIFGAPTTTQQPTTGSIFGGGTTGGFGTTATQPAAGGFGAFGPQQPTTGTNTGTGIFGGGSAFGQPQQQPSSAFGPFGQSQPATSPFGQPKPATGFGSTFGQPSAPSAFSQPAVQPAGASIFGQPQQQQTPIGFGTTTTTKPSIFGQSNQPAGTTGFGTGLVFGNTTTQSSGGLFGGTPSGSLFGGTQANQAQQPGQTSLFAKPPTTGTGLFGGNLGQPNTASSTGTQPNLFVQGQQTPQPTMGPGGLGKPITASSTGTQPNLFVQGQQTAQPTTGTGGFGLFGQQKPVTPTISITPSTSLGSSMFGPSLSSSAAASSGPGILTASIAEPISSNLPIFSMLPPGPRAFPMDQQQKKKPGFFVDAPTRSSASRLPINYTPASSKLRGFRASASSSVLNAPGQNLSLNVSGKAGLLHSSRAEIPEGILGRSTSPALGSGGRQSVKKLVLDTPPPPRNTPSRFTAHSTPGSTSTSPPLQHGDYWVKPDLAKLKTCGYEELSSFKDLVVGRVGYGEIRFLEPVDLTGLPKLGALLGELVRFDDKECYVYPDSDEADKPAPGTGLNVKARILLLRCWAMDKATREPIKDEQAPAAVKHLKRLKAMKDTHFESFVMNDGKWLFTVDHF